ncbi:hypothetical protein GJQ57_21005 [Ralstonia pickettii]|uniref:Uncharacterized protein n=1 Tax=Ralstonia pickettii TaxID=329 RepID=A0A7X2HRW1_RALPI|nr:hypothetical protein [Ralstonia pickettii]MRT01130.1 hypothetical protein [Ralstonia pickettii]
MGAFEDVREGEDVTYLPGSERRPAHESHMPAPQGGAFIRSEMSVAMADAAIANALAMLARHKPRYNHKR